MKKFEEEYKVGIWQKIRNYFSTKKIDVHEELKEFYNEMEKTENENIVGVKKTEVPRNISSAQENNQNYKNIESKTKEKFPVVGKIDPKARDRVSRIMEEVQQRTRCIEKRLMYRARHIRL